MPLLQTMATQIKTHPVFFLFLSAIIVRLFFLLFISLPDQTGGDIGTYSYFAYALLRGDFGGSVLYIAPGYSFFLALLYGIFGAGTAVLVSFQFFLSGLLAVAMFYLGRLLFSHETVALTCGAVGVFWPPFVIQSFEYGNSTLLVTLLLTVAIGLLIWGEKKQRYKALFGAGGMLGLTALTEPAVLYLSIPLVGWLLLTNVRRHLSAVRWTNLHAFLLPSVVLLLAFVIVVTPWAYRNARLFPETIITPIISKDIEKEIFQEKRMRLFLHTFSPEGVGVLVSGLAKEFLVPYNLSLLSHGQTLQYKQLLFSQGERNVSLSFKEGGILILKILITMLHLFALALATVAFVRNWRTKWCMAIALVLLYLTIIPIGVGALLGDNFNGISSLNSFLFYIMPLLLVLAVSEIYPFLRGHSLFQW